MCGDEPNYLKHTCNKKSLYSRRSDKKEKYVGWISSGAYTSDITAVYASELTLNPVVTKLIGMDLTGIAFEMTN
jgi:hypothetical protein